MTAIAVVAIAAIGVVFTTLIWPSIKGNITRSTNCAQSFGCTGTGDLLDCKYLDDAGATKTVKCPKK